MSRTFKDKPSKLRFDYNTDRIMTEGWSFRQLPTTKPKKRKELDIEDHWIGTPGWWVHMTMNKPQRRAVHLWEKRALISDIEELDIPTKKVAFVYFW